MLYPEIRGAFMNKSVQLFNTNFEMLMGVQMDRVQFACSLDLDRTCPYKELKCIF